MGAARVESGTCTLSCATTRHWTTRLSGETVLPAGGPEPGQGYVPMGAARVGSGTCTLSCATARRWTTRLSGETVLPAGPCREERGGVVVSGEARCQLAHEGAGALAGWPAPPISRVCRTVAGAAATAPLQVHGIRGRMAAALASWTIVGGGPG
eukprot:366029-Chlamydomonas_euryale.AAC.5